MRKARPSATGLGRGPSEICTICTTPRVPVSGTRGVITSDRPHPEFDVSHFLHRNIRLAKREDGTAIVEFAFVVPVLLILVLGILDFGKAMNYWIDQNHLASTGARWAAVNKNPGPGSTLQQSVRLQGDTAQLRDGARVCIRFPNGAAVGQPVEVKMSFDYAWLPFIANRLDIATTTITGTATMRLEAIPSYSAGAGGTGTCA